MCGNVAKEVDGEIAMSKKIRVFFITICLATCGGCNLLEGAVSNVSGWDISACVSGFGTCWELWRDNADKFESGFTEAMENLP